MFFIFQKLLKVVLDVQHLTDSHTHSLPETNNGWSDPVIILIVVVVAVVIVITGFICLMNRFKLLYTNINWNKSQFTLYYFII